MTGNSEQIEYWNGAVGERWARLQERIDLHLGGITEAALRFAAPRRGERVLDIGCGAGTTTFLLAFAAGQEGSAAGIDVSRPMLGVAKARAMAQNAAVAFIQADASDYDFQPVFDLAFSRFGVMFFSDPVRAFSNIRSALAPGGRLAFVCWRRMAENLWAAEPMAAALHLLPTQEPADPLAPGPFALAEAGRIRDILSGAGFALTTISPFDGTMNMGATLEDAAAECFNVGPLARASGELDEERRGQIRKVVEDVYAKYVSSVGVTPPAGCWLVSARG